MIILIFKTMKTSTLALAVLLLASVAINVCVASDIDDDTLSKKCKGSAGAATPFCRSTSPKFQNRNQWKLNYLGNWSFTSNSYAINPTTFQYGYAGTTQFYHTSSYDDCNCQFVEVEFYPQGTDAYAIQAIELPLVNPTDTSCLQQYGVKFITPPIPSNGIDLTTNIGTSVQLNDVSGASSFIDPVTKNVTFEQVQTLAQYNKNQPIRYSDITMNIYQLVPGLLPDGQLTNFKVALIDTKGQTTTLPTCVQNALAAWNAGLTCPDCVTGEILYNCTSPRLRGRNGRCPVC